MNDETIAEADMSFSQFAELISSLNCGNGIPVTIRYTEKDKEIPAIAETVNKCKQFRQEMNEHFDEIFSSVKKEIKDVEALFQEKKNIGVRDREEILKKLYKIEAGLGSNLDFAGKQFDIMMEKSVVEAKGEIEAFMGNRIHSLAMEALKDSSDKNAESNSFTAPLGLADRDSEDYER